MQIEARLEALGLVLPAPIQVPGGMRLSFTWVRVRGNRAYISGHIAVNSDGPEVGLHARSSIGMQIPLNAPVNCEAEVAIDRG